MISGIWVSVTLIIVFSVAAFLYYLRYVLFIIITIPVCPHTHIIASMSIRLQTEATIIWLFSFAFTLQNTMSCYCSM